MEYSKKISETSLFAELVKDKHKRKKALQEIIEKQEENSNSNGAFVINDNSNSVESNTPQTADTTTASETSAVVNKISANNANGNAMANDKPTLDINNIPMPNKNNQISNNNISMNVSAAGKDETDRVAMTASNSQAKPKSLTALPMPPGINAADLVEAATPSPVAADDNATPPVVVASNKKAHAKTSSSTAAAAAPLSTSSSSGSVGKSLLNLPMPPMVPGSEELSGDDLINSPEDFDGAHTAGSAMNKSSSSAAATSSSSSKTATNNTNASSMIKARKRPVILNRRDSRNNVRDWGERCVDVFEMLAQIGEGTYGQVSV